MAEPTNPAIKAFVSRIANEVVLAQVLIRRAAKEYEVRHTADRDTPAHKLRRLNLADLRTLAQFTASGAFRPLKSAPNLRSGWRLAVAGGAELESALNQLYPGAIADWYAAESPAPPVTHYRDFTNRQTGMYRVTTLLSDAQVGRVARVCCHERFCLKRRLWTADGMAPDSAEEKSSIPCLEPCAVLLEFARKAMRIDQEHKINVELAPGDIASIHAALESALAHSNASLPEADFNAPANPRRLQLVLEKLATLPRPLKVEAEESETNRSGSL